MNRRFWLLAIPLVAQSGLAGAADLPRDAFKTVVDPRPDDVVSARLLPSCEEGDAPLVLRCTPQTPLASPADSRLLTLRSGVHRPYSQLFTWR